MVANSSKTHNMKDLLSLIIADPALHCRWLNTLSFMENCGARLIANCEHPTKVKEEMLKHAAEEFRHAYYLKQQIAKVSTEELTNYSSSWVLGNAASRRYLKTLDLKTCCYLKKKVGLKNESLKAAAYILVTYTIELRAGSLYPLYHRLLKEQGSKVTVKSILLEEEEHLAEMRTELNALQDGMEHAQVIAEIEQVLYENWAREIAKSVEMRREAISNRG